MREKEERKGVSGCKRDEARKKHYWQLVILEKMIFDLLLAFRDDNA